MWSPRTLTIATIAAALGAGACGSGSSGPIVARVDVEGFEVDESTRPPGLELEEGDTMAFAPMEIRVPEGRVEFSFANTGRLPHTFVIEARGFKLQALEPGDTASAVADLPEGAYFFYCDIEGHRGAGMEGALFVGDVPGPTTAEGT